MPICVTALCGRVSVQAQAGFAPAAIIPKEAVPIDPKQERHISMQSAKSQETAATSARKKNGKKKKTKKKSRTFSNIKTNFFSAMNHWKQMRRKEVRSVFPES